MTREQARGHAPTFAGARPGGRSARVQAAVHAATRELLDTVPREKVTVPAIAQAAGVTPSTIYRRWGDLQELLADVAVELIRPDAGPEDTGAVRSDLVTWLEDYADEMSSELGQRLLRDILASRTDTTAARCCDMVRERIAVMADRAAARGEAFPDVETVVDRLVAPVIYRILFDEPPGPVFCRDLVSGLLDR
uniref:TetR/AcrR family transcriptional regulator n=1 Tax=Stappia sp. TaxID=1870903 RepID=UPI003BADB9A0